MFKLSKILLVFLVLLTLSTVFFSCSGSEKEEKLTYEERVRKNTYKGKIIGLAISTTDSLNMVKGNPAGGAVAGAAVGYFFVGPLGGLIGAGAGAQLEDYSEIQHKKINELVVVCQDTVGDTSYFSVVQADIFHARIDNPFSKQSVPTYLQLLLILKPGEVIRIPTHRSLSRTAKVLANFVYVKKEKIPYIDYIPKRD